MKTATAKVGGITQSIERERARFQEKYSEVCITRAAVNENVRTHTLSTCRLQGSAAVFSTSWQVDNTITHLWYEYLWLNNSWQLNTS